MGHLKGIVPWLIFLTTVVAAESRFATTEPLENKSKYPHNAAHAIPAIVDNMHTIRMSDNGRYLVTLERENGEIRIRDIHGNSQEVILYVGIKPELLGIYENLLYVSHKPGPAETAIAAQGFISIVDMQQGRLIRRVVGAEGLEGIVLDNSGGRILTTNPRQNSLSTFTSSQGRHIKTVSLLRYGKHPRGMDVSADGLHTLVTLEASAKFLVLDNHLNVIKTVATADLPYAISYNDDGKQIYVSTGRDKLLQVFDAKSYQKIAEIGVESDCQQFSFSQDLKSLLLACQQPAQILVIRTDTYTITKRLPMPSLPQTQITTGQDHEDAMLAAGQKDV